jgi:hypothetical protein
MTTTWPIVFMGTPQIAAATLAELVQGPDPVVGVVTQPDRPSGRGQQSAPSPVRNLPRAATSRVVAPEKIRTADFLEILRRWKPEIIVVVAYGRILPKTVLDLAPQGCLNVHYSLLPKYRGAAPAAWTIINGETEGGVTTMKLVEKMDAGRDLSPRSDSRWRPTKPPARCRRSSRPSARACCSKPCGDSKKVHWCRASKMKAWQPWRRFLKRKTVSSTGAVRPSRSSGACAVSIPGPAVTLT